MDFNIKITGEAGQGLQTIGQLLGKYLVRQGHYIFANQDNESRIRGGHNFYQLRVSNSPVLAMSEEIDLLIPLDRAGIELHLEEVKHDGVVLVDSNIDSHPRKDERFLAVPFKEIAMETGERAIYANSGVLASVIGLLDLNYNLLEEYLKKFFGKTGETNAKVAAAAYEFVRQTSQFKSLSLPLADNKPRMFINGHEALALGALAAGCGFMAAYPMSPSTSIITYLADKQDEFKLVVEQAEDEIAAINMTIGASYTGVRAMTATSGGGFSLMVEALGLAGMTETPIVIVNAQRPGPATGLPTRTEQGDLEFVIHAAQGEFPRFILAPRNAEEAFYVGIRAFNLADKFQVPVIILTDQHLAESYSTIEKFDLDRVRRAKVNYSTETAKEEEIYLRYRYTDNGISPISIPGTPGISVRADSDEHDESGRIIEDAETREKMMNKRMGKLAQMKVFVEPPEVLGHIEPEWVLIGWGSTYGALAEACDVLNERGYKVQMHCLSDVWPIDKETLGNWPTKSRLVAVEGNYSGQLARQITAVTGRRFDYLINRYDGRPFSPKYIINRFFEIVSERREGIEGAI